MKSYGFQSSHRKMHNLRFLLLTCVFLLASMIANDSIVAQAPIEKPRPVAKRENNSSLITRLQEEQENLSAPIKSDAQAESLSDKHGLLLEDDAEEIHEFRNRFGRYYNLSNGRKVAGSFQAGTIKRIRAEDEERSLLDLQKFFKMKNPKAAAKALREYVQIHGIPLNAHEISPGVKVTLGKPEKLSPTTPNASIQIFNGMEFIPKAGMEKDLSIRIQQMSTESIAEQRIVCILQTQDKITLGNVIEILETGVKIYESVGRNAVIVRLPVSVISSLSSRQYIRWIGEYKPEYKYKKTLGTIYTFGGGQPEYCINLQKLGLKVKRYDFSLNGYEVILDDVAISKVAQTLWWVKGIDISVADEEKGQYSKGETKHSNQCQDVSKLSRFGAIPELAKKLSQSNKNNSDRIDIDQAPVSVVGLNVNRVASIQSKEDTNQQIVPEFRNTDEGPGLHPNHPPINRIPPIPMPEPKDQPIKEGSGMPVFTTQYLAKTTFLPNEEQLIHVFSGIDFIPTAGLEKDLLTIAQMMVTESKGEEKIVCIIQIQGSINLENIMEHLKVNVKIFEPIGKKATVIRTTASDALLLCASPYVRWIGEYKPEYKYKKLVGVIYPLGGDYTEYRADLEQHGIKIRKFNNRSKGYEVLLNDVAINEIAESFWWVKGLHLEGAEADKDEHRLKEDKPSSRPPEHPELFSPN